MEIQLPFRLKILWDMYRASLEPVDMPHIMPRAIVSSFLFFSFFFKFKNSYDLENHFQLGNYGITIWSFC